MIGTWVISVILTMGSFHIVQQNMEYTDGKVSGASFFVLHFWYRLSVVGPYPSGFDQ